MWLFITEIITISSSRSQFTKSFGCSHTCCADSRLSHPFAYVIPLYVNCLFGRALHSLAFPPRSFAEIAFDHYRFCCIIRLQNAVRTVHYTHETGTAFVFIIKNMAAFNVLGKSAAHTGHDTFRFVTMTAEQRLVTA